MERTRLTLAAVWSAVWTVALLFILTVVADLAPSVKSWLASSFSHHWIGKGVLASAFFIVLSLVLTAMKPRDPVRSLRAGMITLSWVAALATILLVGFFWYETAV